MDKTYTRINWQNEPSVATPINDVNLNKMDYSLNEVDNRIITLDTSKADQSDLLQTVKAVTYNTTTGVFTFTFWNGTVVTADLNIEKIPVSFSMSPQGVITMTTADGTQYTADVSELIKTYSFVDSSEIDFTVTTDSSGNKSVTASIIAGSITGEKLQPNFLADCQTAKNQAESAAGSASSSATSSELSSEDSEAWAVGTRDGVPVPSTDPAYENNAKWWAQHGTGSSFAGLSDTNFTNLQNGQIAKYNSTTQMWENTEDEGGLLPHFKITSEAGSTVTVVCPDTSVITPTQTSSGIWQCDVPAYGVYTVHAVINGDDAVRTVTVDTVKEYVIHDEHYSYTLNVYAPTGSSIIVTDGGSETYTGTGAGSTAVIFALHQASTTYTITVTYDGLDIDTTITSSATSGGSGSKTITFGTINLTVDEDLIGEIIVMAKGTDTVSKVASSTSMVFYPNATGNWTISCEYDGETYYSEPNPVVVSSLSTAVSAEISLVHIPEGATVLPTDDIQTWLACANITDKSYTTLAEVLADRETFEILIADSNACDYMARSTSWANPNLVPKMTSNTTPEGIADADSEYSSTYQAWKAFDGTNIGGSASASTDCWASTGPNTFPKYLQYKFETSKVVRKIKVTTRNSDTATDINSPKDVTFKAYNGSSYDTLGTYTNNTATTSNTTFEFTVNNNTPYEYYKLEIGSINKTTTGTGNTDYYCCVGQMKYYEYADASIVEDQDAMSLIGKYDYCSNALLNNATWAEAIANSDYFEEVLNVSVPAMTSNTTPSGVVSASSVSTNPNHPAWYAFDHTAKTSTTEHGWSTSGTGAIPAWLQYEFVSPVIINRVDIRPYNNTFANSKNFKIQASNDGFSSDINDLYTGQFSDDATASKPCITIDFANNTSYKYYRVYIIDTWGTQWIGLSYLQFFGRKSNGATNTNGIIHTANGDTVTCNGNTYVADTNGIIEIDFSDFDEGTYTFTSSIAKNPDNLSQDYTKQFKITKSPHGGTTELYLMPDAVKTLYWWGYMANSGGFTNRGGTAATKTLTLNTYDIEVNVTSGTCAVGTNQTINTDGFTKLCGITKATNKGITFISSPTLGSAPQNDGYGRTGILSQNNAIEKLQADLTNTGDVYTYIFQSLAINQTSKSNTYALWYE